MIDQRTDDTKQLAIHTCSGKISAEDLIDAIKSLYEKDPTPNHLWDMREADLTRLTSEDVKRIALFAKNYAPARVGGKTAVVAPQDIAFGLSRMFGVFVESPATLRDTSSKSHLFSGSQSPIV